MSGREEKIRDRAYRLWIEEGQPHGRTDLHWERARGLLDEEEPRDTAAGAIGPAADAAAAGPKGS